MTKTTLYFIGMGLGSIKNLPYSSLAILEKADHIYVEYYTNYVLETPREVQRFFSEVSKRAISEIKFADRTLLEEDSEKLLELSLTDNVVLLVSGDPFIATTHLSLRLEAIKKGIPVQIYHNASILSAAASVSGLQAYKFGKTATIPFPENKSQYPYDILHQNQEINAHTLFLLDINLKEQRYLTITSAIEQLEELEAAHQQNIFTKETKMIGISRLSFPDQYIAVGTPQQLKALPWERYGAPQCIIVCAKKLHFTEEEALSVLWKSRSEK